jgi:hypothetical protein
MSDLDRTIELIQSGRLTTAQLLQFQTNGQIPAAPGEGVRVQFLGYWPPYADLETATLHEALAGELVRRGVCAYVP